MRVAFRKMRLPDDWPWIRQHLPLLFVEGAKGIVAFNIDTRETIGAMVVDSWTHTSAECHIISTHTATFRHGFHKICADYLFNTCKRLKVYGKVQSDNVKALKLDEKLGFREVARLEDAAEVGIDIVLMELTRENCPYWERSEV